MEAATWVLAGLTAISLICGGIYWLSYVSLMLGKMISELQAINKQLAAISAAHQDHEKRISKLEAQCNIKQRA